LFLPSAFFFAFLLFFKKSLALEKKNTIENEFVASTGGFVDIASANRNYCGGYNFTAITVIVEVTIHIVVTMEIVTTTIWVC